VIGVALRGLAGRKLRAALTAIAVVLGVAMISGTFVLTDSIQQAFNFINTEVRAGSDVVVSGKSAFNLSNNGQGSVAPTLSPALLAQLRALPGTELAQGAVASQSTSLVLDGKAIAFGGAPNLGFSVIGGSPFNPLTLVAGRWPHGQEVVVDASTASKKGLKPGDRIGVQAAGPVEQFTISGTVSLGGSNAIGGATLAGFDLPTAQHLFDKQGQFDQFALQAKPGVTPTALLQQVKAILPTTAEARTGAQQAAKDAADTDSFIGFLRDFLLAFGGIALFVGSFVIANSLSITIAQRTRELATLRTLGASRRQVLRLIFVESLVMGTFASIVGLFVGLGLAKGLFWLFDKVGFTLPNSGIVFESRTIVVALLAGIIVTLIASMRPAIRATRVEPIAAVREGATLPPSRFARYRTVGSALVTAAGFALLLIGLFVPGLGTKGVLLYMGIGALLIFIGVSMLSRGVVGPLASTVAPPARWLLTAIWLGSLFLTPVGWIYQLYHRARHGAWPTYFDRSSAGALARDNARRNPQRTASTAAALMIGLALVTLVAVLAAGIVSSFRGAVNDIWHNADYAITAQNNFSPIPVAAADAAARSPVVDAVANVRTGEALAFGSSFFATAVNPAGASMFNLKWTSGSSSVLAHLGANGAFTDKDYATAHNLHLGSPVRLTFADGARKTFVIKGIFDPPTGGSPFGRITISESAWDAENASPENLYSFVRVKGGATDAKLAQLQRDLAAYPNAKVQTRQQFIDNQISGLNSILNVLYVLLMLSVIVSLFGIINTLVLTVFERTREIGMLRAIGMTRSQVRRMIRHESVITALIGGVLGIALGIVLGALLVARVDFIVFALPVGSLIVFAIATIVVGLLAAILPARRAAKLNVLEALQYE
jgi:putative ABC transport system permease protein